MKRKEKIERVREVAQILCDPRIGDRVKVLECTIPGHQLLGAPCYALFNGMAGTERIVTKTMMYTFTRGGPMVQIWLTKGVDRPSSWWLARHQFEILDE